MNKVNFIPSSNFSAFKKKRSVEFIIIHYTGMRSLQSALERLLSRKHQVSSHYLISRNGKVFQLVKNNNVAWHAGVSNWFGFKNLNKTSIGIELENKGHRYRYENFTHKKIFKLIKILKILKKKFKVKNKNIVGHSDIAPDRKIDPGEKFPWKKLSENNLSIWHSLDEKIISNFRLKKIKTFNKKQIFIMAKKLGYSRVFLGYGMDINFVKAFQRRFRQQLVNGFFDQECYLILNNLQKFI